MSSTSPSSLLWFQLVDSSTGNPYKETTADCVSLPPGLVIAQFRKAVKSENSNKLSSIDASDLLVYKNKVAFDKRNAAIDEEKENPLKASHTLDGLGTSDDDDMLIVAVPSSSVTIGSPLSSHAPPNRRITDQFLTDNNLDLSKPEDVIKFLQLKINALAPFNQTKPYHSTFLDNCLEYRLDRRQTTYTFDNTDNIKVLLSVSGSGKTRQLLELLHSQFGYFFVVDRHLKDFGSEDLGICKLYSVGNPGRGKYFIRLLYFVRGFICSYLFDLGYNTPADILLAQVHPLFFFGCDLFAELYEIAAQYTAIKIDINGGSIRHWFDCVAIDEIQSCIEGDTVFRLPNSVKNRPFLSPLLYYSKHTGRFPKFIVSGTGINFSCLTELLQSGAYKDHQVTAYDVISNLKPLDKNQAESYICQMLCDHNIPNNQIQEVIEMVCTNPLFLGRGRFISSIVDSILQGNTVHWAISKFLNILSEPASPQFPLKFYKKYGPESLGRVIETSLDGRIVTLGEIIQNGMIQCFMKGTAKLLVNDQAASDMVQHGIGFCTVDTGVIQSVTLEEQAIIECLRYIIPVSSLIPVICRQLGSFPKPHMVGTVLEYVVAYALVAGLNMNNKQNLKSTYSNFISYLNSNDEEQVFFPHHFCGPDIVYKFRGTVYIVQVKFVNTISKQKRVKACCTTDPTRFYWNQNKNTVMKGFEEKQEAILSELNMFEIVRIVFLHTLTKTTAGMDDVRIINQEFEPHFFDLVHTEMWEFLNQLRAKFNQ